ncbi:MAG: hypothetical protein QM767_15960 [Anaeromyxobacter sp.]
MTRNRALRVPTLLLLLLAVALGGLACSKGEGTLCASGRFCPPGSQCAVSDDACIWDGCGDGHVDDSPDPDPARAGKPLEVCDDGNLRNGDGCRLDCKSDETCGNDEDDPDVGEVCDDDNNDDGDGCSADCRSTEACGNTILDPGEVCDGGPSGIPDVGMERAWCNDDCTAARCNDGKVNEAAGEQCDRNGDGVPGSSGQSATCNVNCTASVCGDDFINPQALEECDRGPGMNSDSGDCLTSCKVNVCGDGYPNDTLVGGRPREECDAGSGNSDTGACTTACKNAVCGDGHVQAGVETCDEGSGSVSEKTACPYGQTTCTVCSACQTVTLTGPYCGDGTQQNPPEACDQGTSNGATTCAYHQDPFTCQNCNAVCTAYVPVAAPYCGDGSTNGPEACDDGNTVNESSCAYGQASCEGCRSDCLAKLTLQGAYCGDFHVDSGDGEVCDSSQSFACGVCIPAGQTGACTFYGNGTSGSQLAAAEGALLVSGLGLVGVTFTLGDDVNTSPWTFEFVDGGPAQPGNVPISITGMANTGDVAGAILAALPATLRIDATVSGSEVRLVNRVTGIVGNLPIEIAPAGTTALTGTGMGGGRGCGAGQACSRDRDCVSLNCRPSHTCGT